MKNNKNMSARGGSAFGGKKILIIALVILGVAVLAVLGMAALATPAMAATTVSLSPVSVNVEEGQTFNLTVSVNSQVVKSYMVKSEIKFPADIFEVESFNFGNSWMPLIQTGYNLIDNTNGILIKTAGYPGGLSSQADFGTIVFKAKKNGTGAVQVTGNSLALNADNLNVISGLPITASITITQAQVVPPTPKAQTQPKANVIIPTPKENTTPAAPEQPIAQAPQPSLLAAIGVVLTLGTGNIWLGILVGLIILAVIIYVVYSLIQKKKQKFGKI